MKLNFHFFSYGSTMTNKWFWNLFFSYGSTMTNKTYFSAMAAQWQIKPIFQLWQHPGEPNGCGGCSLHRSSQPKIFVLRHGSGFYSFFEILFGFLQFYHKFLAFLSKFRTHEYLIHMNSSLHWLVSRTNFWFLYNGVWLALMLSICDVIVIR